MSVSDDEPDAAAQSRERLQLLDALVAALSRRAEVFDVISKATDPEDAESSLRTLLGIGPVQAAAITDLQLRRFTAQERVKMKAMRDELRDSLRER